MTPTVPSGTANDRPATHGPLAGIRVIEMAGIGPAPFAAMSLADLGADVIRIDRPVPAEISTAPPERDVLNRGKRSVVLDLKHPDGHQALLRLIDTADVLVEGFRPGVMERLGLGPGTLLERNPRLVFIRMTGWGQDGPLAPTAGHEVNYLAVTGLLASLGAADGPPQVPPPLIGDYAASGAYAVIGALAGLVEAARTGRGQVVDAAMVDGTAHLMAAIYSMLAAGRWNDQRGTNLLDGASPFYTVYETADGKWISVGALENKFFATLLRELQIGPDVYDAADQHDRSQWPRLRDLLAATFRTKSRDHWAEHFATTDACVAPVVTLREGMAHSHLLARRTVLVNDGHIQPCLAPRFPATAHGVPGPSPLPGEHTIEILDEVGLPADELIGTGAARTPTQDRLSSAEGS
ncbi:CaiB/BaiF CoA transferase family protein [Acrocarpospora catenulata]|uniref:CaiB/BaiF CoA transferase family protein n=1 Tax=Acrocarpospora catenulata TaxID=2836182 RepID=UPI001BDAE270|nr:CaiB/BaiF CoA-transferase family protein [Acrocarpospora catenulata]